MYMGENEVVRKYKFWSLLINLMNTVIPYYSLYKNEYKPTHFINTYFS